MRLATIVFGSGGDLKAGARRREAGSQTFSAEKICDQALTAHSWQRFTRALGHVAELVYAYVSEAYVERLGSSSLPMPTLHLCPHQESNLDQELRSLLHYPLCYGGKITLPYFDGSVKTYAPVAYLVSAAARSINTCSTAVREV